MSTLGDVVMLLRSSVDRLPFSELADALDAAEEARTLLEQATHGSGQTELHQLLDWFQQAIDDIGVLQQKLTAIQQSVTSVANRIEDSGRTRAPWVPVPLPSAPTETPPDTTRAATLLAKLPTRGPDNRKTSGRWVNDESGEEYDPVTSGRDDYARVAGDVLRGLGIAPPRGDLMTADHVEVKVATTLRGMTARNVTLAVNNRPCNQGPWSCDRLLPRILRPDQSITVYWPGGQQTYRGKET